MNGHRELRIKAGIGMLQDLCHERAVESGWWHDIETGEKIEKNKAELLCLIHSEISEAMEGLRKGLMDDKITHRPMVEVELADAIIRIMDMAGGFGYDIAGSIIDKLEYNKNRADHQIDNRKKDGGKKF